MSGHRWATSSAREGLAHPEALAVTVGDERVVVVQDERGELGARGGPDPALDEPDGCGVLLVPKRDESSSMSGYVSLRLLRRGGSRAAGGASRFPMRSGR